MTSFYIKDQNGLQTNFQTTTLISKTSSSEIYRIKSSSNTKLGKLCFKKLKNLSNNKELQSKIEMMVSQKPFTDLDNRSKICWPSHCVFDAKDYLVGYLMPLAIPESITLDEILKNERPNNTEFSIFKENTQASYDLRLKTCLNISRSLNQISQLRKYTFLSFTPDNIMVSKKGHISLIGCDSILEPTDIINSSDKKLRHIPEYTPPEVLKTNAFYDIKNEFIERYSLAVMFYQLLFRVHPFFASFKSPYSTLKTIDEKVEQGLFVHGEGKKFVITMPPEHNSFTKLNHKLKTLFHSAFDLKNRPKPPHIWAGTLAILIDNNNHGLKPNPDLNLKTVTEDNNKSKNGTSSPEAPSIKSDNVETNSKNSDPSEKDNSVFIFIVIAALCFLTIITIDATMERKDNSQSNQIETTLYEHDDTAYINNSSTESKNSYNDTYELSNIEVPSYMNATITNQHLYVLADTANLRQYPSLDSAVVMQVDYNTKLNKTSAPPVEDKGTTWINVVNNDGTRGWISSVILSKYPRNILHSECGLRDNEIKYIVNSTGVNIRSTPNMNEQNVIGVIQKGEIICPYMYEDTFNKSIGRWMGFQLTTGSIAWVAESFLTQYYEPEPISQDINLNTGESPTDSAKTIYEAEYYDGSGF